ncbi:MAG TPA: hypothetical protein PLB62_05165, partial [Candidatus Sumerlaeota bacterium]|nr:hypothetical protein [Candidatus Sumerlaeota bacterium]
PVKAWVNTVLRSGPGTDYPLVASISVGQEGFVVDHSLNGLSAKGQNWVKWSTGTAEGWTPEYVFYESTRVQEWDSVE